MTAADCTYLAIWGNLTATSPLCRCGSHHINWKRNRWRCERGHFARHPYGPRW